MTKTFSATSTADDVLSDVDLTGKRFLITGVSSGIGLETARALVSRGASVIGAVRDQARALSATAAMHQTAPQGGNLALITLDLASLPSVYACAERLLAEGQPFDAIIANAGVMATPFGMTVEGFERQLGTNFLGHFALIRQIASLLSANGRVVLLSSQAHRLADVDLDDPNFAQQTYDPWVAYGRSKTAMALFAVEFDRRYRPRGMRAASVMPGNSFTELPRHLSPEDLQALFGNVAKARAEDGLPPAELKDISQATATTVWAAVVADHNEIGGLYLEDCAIAPVNDLPNPYADGVRSYALNAERAQQLWTRSEEWLSAALARSPGAV
ncbi:SDR family NAD(P)-dependent oxidoreductase [Sodalis endosymbiont of Spalangia cameroni]|uniref:SDR family NAD(P)-dependent oxidoreductase n=1 Tax=Sodalis praecaptivus TaxID=1239307 RepID=UPI0031F9AB0E